MRSTYQNEELSCHRGAWEKICFNVKENEFGKPKTNYYVVVHYFFPSSLDSSFAPKFLGLDSVPPVL